MKKPYKYIDLTYLQNFSNGDENFIREIISIAIAQTKNEITNLKYAMETNDYQKTGQICHKMRSSLGFIGIQSHIIEKLKEIEGMANEKKEVPEDHTLQIIEVCAAINAELTEVLVRSKGQ